MNKQQTTLLLWFSVVIIMFYVMKMTEKDKKDSPAKQDSAIVE